MNATLENLGPCKKQLRVEVAADRVKNVFEEVSKYFVKNASLPGFRRGKAPKDMVLKKFEQDITDEAKKKLYSEVYSQALKDHSIEAITDPDVEEVQFGRDQDAKLVFTIETAPQFELPEYRGLPATRTSTKVSEEDLERALAKLREQKSTFETVAREVKDNDFVVIHYTGTCEGQPISALAPAARGLTEQKNFWVRVAKDHFIPGFAEQLIGAKAGDKRTVTVDFPADFVTPQLQGKKGSFDVEIAEVKEQHLPELNDEFAKLWKAETLHQLREGIRADLQNELNTKEHRSVRTQTVEALMARVDFDLPEVAVSNETRNVVYSIVAENKQRGVADELIEQQKKEIHTAAEKTAKERVKASFLFSKIATKEGIKVSNEELSNRIVALARRYQMTPEKLVAELKERNGIQEIVGQILHEKVVDFLQQHAKIEDAPAS